MSNQTIYDWVKSEESRFETDEIQVGQNWLWNLRNHVQIIFHLKNGQFYTGENNWLRAFKNIMEPMLQLAYWTEDLEVKDVVFFIESTTGRVLSFLTKKYHDEKYVREHDLDTLFDEITESDIDYGGVLVQKGPKRPELLALNAVAFGDQTDLMGGPLFFKHNFTPAKLRQMSKVGWGKPENGATISLEDLCMLATETKDVAGSKNDRENQVPGKTIEVYVGRGDMKKDYLNEDGDEETCKQVQVLAYYTDKENKRHGVTLYRKEDYSEGLMFHTSQKVHGRALGRGAGEALLGPQVWTNFLEIHKMKMLEAGSKVIPYTDDENYKGKNNLDEVENLEVQTVAEGRTFGLVPTIGVANIQLYGDSINTWFEHAQLTGAAFDPVLGKEPTSGTTFRGQERTVAQGRGMHDRRRGQRAKFIETIYRTWIIPDIKKEILKGTKFLATLSAEELNWVADQLATNHANNKIKEKLLKGEIVSEEEQTILKQTFKETFAKGGNKQLIEILKGEFEDVEINMGINIAGKQKDLAMLSDKLLSIFQFIFANPAGFQQAMQMPALSKAFQDILEFSGLNQADFATLMMAQGQPQVATHGPQQPGQQQQAPMALNAAPAPAE
jgi:hypothetical protein